MAATHLTFICNFL